MADNIIEATQEAAELQVNTQQAELAQQMAISLNGGLPLESNQPPVADSIAAKEVIIETEAPQFQFQTFTEKFGYQSPDDAIKEIEELRTLKANPIKEAIKFENEKSEVLFKAIQAGKSDEVYAILAEQKRLDALTTSEVTKETAADIIKLGMQLKYKDLTEAEINYKFNKQFSLPKEPVQGNTELDEEFEQRQKDWQEQVADIEMSKIIDAKLVKPDLEAAKQKLVLPNIESAVDEGYLQYKKSLEEEAKVDTETVEAYKSFTPTDIEMKINFNDEANKINFDFQFTPEAQGFEKSVALVIEPEKYFAEYKNSDGTPNRKQFLQDIYFIQHKEQIIREAMKQAKNATIKSMLPDNSSGAANRQLPQGQEMSDLDKMMQASLAGYTR